MYTLEIKDESFAGAVLNKILLQFKSEEITVKELIKARIEVEIKRYEKDAENYKNGLVLPTHLVKEVNKTNKKIDLEKQLYIALKSFQENGFFILVDDEQVESLDQKFHINESVNIAFIKLTPLVGG